MAHLRVAVTLDRPPREVWRHLERIETHSRWMRDCDEVRFVGTQRRGVGTRFVAVTRVLGITLDDEIEVVRWRPRRALAVRHEGAVTGAGEFRLRPTLRGGTRFEWRETLHFPLWMGGPVGAALALPVLRHFWRGSLRNLKQLVESG